MLADGGGAAAGASPDDGGGFAAVVDFIFDSADARRSAQRGTDHDGAVGRHLVRQTYVNLLRELPSGASSTQSHRQVVPAAQGSSPGESDEDIEPRPVADLARTT